jgi:hypothetical protein
MNLYKSLIAGLALLGWAGNVSAQNETDALRYSRTFLNGTARTQGFGGAQVAIGADISSMAGNPAGLGLFRRSELSVTTAFSTVNTTSRVEGTGGGGMIQGARTGLNFPSIGIVIADRKDDATEGDWRSGAFGIGFTRLNHFNAELNYRGTATPPNTMVWSFKEMAERRNLRPGESLIESLDNEFGANGSDITTLEGLAYAAYLFDVDEDDDTIFPIEQAGPVGFEERVSNWGAQNQFDLSYGASYRDKIFIGGSIGITSVNFTQERRFTETDNDQQTDFQRLVLSDEFSTRGTGVQGKLGVIFRPSDILRFGASVQTPTLYALTDRYTTNLSVDYNPGFLLAPATNINFETPLGEFAYRLTTPLRASVGAAYFVGKSGFITADLEYVNYGKARLASRDADAFFDASNDIIRNSYTPTLNLKFGGEARVDIFRFRAGYALFGDPTGDGGTAESRSFLTGGAGVRMASFSLDAAVVYGWGTGQYSPYTLNNRSQPVVTTDNKTTHAMLTLGLNF